MDSGHYIMHGCRRKASRSWGLETFFLTFTNGLCLLHLYVVVLLMLVSGDKAVSIDSAKLSKLFT
jgi:hypothetical protein